MSSVNPKVMSCSCDHKFQDEKYGKGMRLFNRTAKTVGSSYVYRCTVCTREKS